jgi:hypothetical protein
MVSILVFYIAVVACPRAKGALHHRGKISHNDYLRWSEVFSLQLLSSVLVQTAALETTDDGGVTVMRVHLACLV